VKGEARGRRRDRPWPDLYPGREPFAPGEHPRLLFRASDLPALRARAETETGKEILARLRLVLGGDGKTLPTRYTTATKAYGEEEKNLPLGTYTLWHGMGYGLLYQLTEDAAYAELARHCVQKALDGQRDRDPRYSFVRPGGKLRGGPSYAAVALAYDLCYGAWDEGFRQEVARRIQDAVMVSTPREFSTEQALVEPVDGDLVFNTLGGQHSPHANHYGAWNGGGGTAILAILGDPGTDPAITERAHRVFLQRARRALEVGYGDSAWFFEGHYGGRLSSNTGLITYLHALRVALGLDYVEPFSGGEWLASKWMYEIVREDGKLLTPMQGIYASDTFARGGHSSGGDFSRGFSILPPSHRPAWLWFYQHEVEPKGPNTYDTFTFPQHAVDAFLFWPIGEEAKNPGEVLPRVLRGKPEQYYVFRSGWTEGNDLIATSFKGQGKLLGMGFRGSFTGPAGIEQSFELQENGTVALIVTDQEAFAADLGGTSGAPMLFVRAPGLGHRPPSAAPAVAAPGVPSALLERFGGGRAGGGPREVAKPGDPRELLTGDFVGAGGEAVNRVVRKARLGNQSLEIVTYQRGFAPKYTIETDAEGDILRIGPRTIRVRGGALELGLAD
jgi:hypothetical protein